MSWLVSASLVVVGLIHLVPSLGVLGADRLHALYGVELPSTETVLLMRHRAVLFGMIGSVMVLAALRPDLHWLGLVLGLVSVSSFLLLAHVAPSLNAQVTRVIIVDWFALCLLLLATFVKLWLV